MARQKILFLLSFFLLLILERQGLANEKILKSVTQGGILPGLQAQYTEYKLDNGMRLFVVPDARNPVATIHLILDAGSDREQLGTTGLAHFFEHMMFRKTKDAPEGNYDRVLNSVGGTGNAGTSDSFVTFYSVFPSPALETMVALEAQRFTHLDLTNPFFETEKGAVISERKLRVENDPMQRSQEILRSIVERGTPLEWMTIGAKADVENMKLAAAQKFYEDFYTPENTIMIVGGPFKPENVAALVEKYFSSWPKKAVPERTALDESYFTRDLQKSFVCSAPVNTKRFNVIYPAPKGSLKDMVYTALFSAILDNQPDGTFERRLVKKKLATGFSFYKEFWKNLSSALNVGFTLTKNQGFEDVKSYWFKSVEQVLKTPLTDKIKNQVLKQLEVSDAESADKMTSLVSNVVESAYFFHDVNVSTEQRKLVKKATSANLKAWIQENLNPKNFYVTGVVPIGEAPSCPELLANLNKETK